MIIIKWIKKVVKSNCFFRSFALSICNSSLLNSRCKVSSRGAVVNLKKIIRGKNNYIFVGEHSILKNTAIRMIGDNNSITFGKNCYVGANCSFWLEGCNVVIHIGDNCTFTSRVHFCAQEDGMSINVEDDCMFSNNIIVRTSDSHPIYNRINGQRINPPKSVLIGKHVWVAPHTNIMKGAIVRDGSIIGSKSLVTNEIPENSLAVGTPAKVVKTDIFWTREKLF